MPAFLDSDPFDTPVPITTAMRRELRRHWQRSGVSTRRVLYGHPPIPNGLTIAMVNDWIANRLHIVCPSHWNHVLKHWSALPDCAAHVKRIADRQRKPGRPRDPEGTERIAVSAAMTVYLRSEMIRTGVDLARDIIDARGAPDGLTIRVVRGWLYHAAKTTRKDHWDFTIRRLHTMPDFKSQFSKR